MEGWKHGGSEEEEKGEREGQEGSQSTCITGNAEARKLWALPASPADFSQLVSPLPCLCLIVLPAVPTKEPSPHDLCGSIQPLATGESLILGDATAVRTLRTPPLAGAMDERESGPLFYELLHIRFKRRRLTSVRFVSGTVTSLVMPILACIDMHTEHGREAAPPPGRLPAAEPTTKDRMMAEKALADVNEPRKVGIVAQGKGWLQISPRPLEAFFVIPFPSPCTLPRRLESDQSPTLKTVGTGGTRRNRLTTGGWDH